MKREIFHSPRTDTIFILITYKSGRMKIRYEDGPAESISKKDLEMRLKYLSYSKVGDL